MSEEKKRIFLTFWIKCLFSLLTDQYTVVSAKVTLRLWLLYLWLNTSNSTTLLQASTTPQDIARSPLIFLTSLAARSPPQCLPCSLFRNALATNWKIAQDLLVTHVYVSHFLFFLSTSSLFSSPLSWCLQRLLSLVPLPPSSLKKTSSSHLSKAPVLG